MTISSSLFSLMSLYPPWHKGAGEAAGAPLPSGERRYLIVSTHPLERSERL